MQFIKVRNVKDPIRDVAENAGIDFYIPEGEETFINDFKTKNPDFICVDHEPEEDEAYLKYKCENGYFNIRDNSIHIPPHKDILIPSGIKSKFENNLALIANNKSGIATKKKLIIGASVIDCSYQGEWHLHLINTSNEWQVVECGQKVVQFIPIVISTDPVEIVDKKEYEFFTEKTNRGEGGFGSSGVN